MSQEITGADGKKAFSWDSRRTDWSALEYDYQCVEAADKYAKNPTKELLDIAVAKYKIAAKYFERIKADDLVMLYLRRAHCIEASWKGK